MNALKNQVNITPGEKILVNEKELASLLSIGKDNAKAIGKNSGAIVKIGRRKLYKVDMIKAYVNTL